MSKQTAEIYNSDAWERLRERFAGSEMRDMELNILGQNAGKSWPFKGSDETPAKYLEFDFDDLGSVPGLIGKKRRIQVLMDILTETLAFDDPFAEMADKVEADGEHDVTYERVIVRFEIPEAYPAEFMAFDSEARALIKNQGCQTLGEVVRYIVDLPFDSTGAEDLKTFLNLLGHKDELGIGRYIPYRRGKPGFHLAEAVGLIAANLPEQLQLELLSQTGMELKPDEDAKLEAASTLTLEGQLKTALEQLDAVAEWFTDEAAGLQQLIEEGGSYQRYFITINNSRTERIALALARIKFGDPTQERTGLMAKLSGIFGK
ncbi:MAG: hypothetical protein ACPGES_01840 [Coraliomargarita sp.]